MLKFDNNYYKLNFLTVFTLILLAAGCASIQQPTGGPKDKEPPKVLKETPANFTLNFKAKEINITFNEYFKISNESKEFSMSPAQDRSPYYKVKGKTLNIKFQDTLAANTTYTINFGRGLVDYNEGNVLKNYMYVFSTGNKIDSLSISGTVTNTLTKKPVLDATVFIIPVNQDTIFGKRRANLFTTTDSSGNFSLKYLRPDTYRVYALKEESGDRIYNSSNEEIAFLVDSVVLRNNIAGVKLALFKEEAKIFRITDRKIEKDSRVTYIFSKKLEQPSISILHPNELDKDKIVEFSRTKDTVALWTKSMDFDSIKVAVIDKGTPLDTTIIRRNSRDKYDREIKIADNNPSNKIKPGGELILTFSAPVGSIDPRKISLLQDSVPVSGLRIIKDSLSTRKYLFRYPWRTERQYILKIDTNAIGGKFGGFNKTYTKQFILDEVLNYGNLSLSVTVPDTSKSYIVQLLDDKDNIIKETPLNKNQTINYTTYSLGKYHFRVVYDDNKNRKWDTGDVRARRQPELTWNSNTEITLRANWDLEEKLTIPPPVP
ncbi:Ig-like domain-containing protein [Arcticibacter tournemirensis]